MVVAKLGADGTLSIFNATGTTEVIVDIEGWFGAEGAPAGASGGRAGRERQRYPGALGCVTARLTTTADTRSGDATVADHGRVRVAPGPRGADDHPCRHGCRGCRRRA